MGGEIGPYINDESNQEYVTENVKRLFQIFKNDPIIVTQQMHPPDHISFLSRHQAEAAENGSEAKKEFMNQEVGPNTNLIIRLLYGTKDIQETSSVDQELNILSMSFQGGMDADMGTTVISQLLWPDNCIAGTDGANLPDLVKGALENIKKNNDKVLEVAVGTNRNMDSVSVVKNPGGEINNEIVSFIQENKISAIYLAGFAFELAVFQTA